ncbi:polysaccharide pyruvyl transferase family protein [Paenibacillus tarimensis]
MPNRIFALHGGCFTENFGDELLLAIHSKWVKEIINGDVVLPYAINIYDQEVNAIKLKGIGALKAAEKLIYSGGGYLGEPNHDQINWGYSFFKRKHFVPAEYFKLTKKPYAIIGAGAGPLTNKFTRKEVIRMCKNAEITAVRDEESKKFLCEYGVPSEKIHVTADLVLSLGLEDLDALKKSKAKAFLNNVEGKKLIGIHLAVSSENPNYGENAQIIQSSIVRFFNNNPDFIPVLIADKRNSSEQNQVIEELSKEFVHKYIVYKHSDIWLTCAILSQLDAVLTTKLHVGITAYSLGTKAFSVAAHQKTLRFYKQIEQNENCLPLEEIRSENVFLDHFQRFLTSNIQTEDHHINIRNKNKEKALINKKLTHDFIVNY